MLGGARAGCAGEELEPLSAPHGPTSLVQPLTFARIHQYISMAVPMLWLRQRDVIGAMGLAVNASRERSNGHPEQSERIEELLATAQELWRECAEIADATSAWRPSARRSSSSTSRTWCRSPRGPSWEITTRSRSGRLQGFAARKQSTVWSSTRPTDCMNA